MMTTVFWLLWAIHALANAQVTEILKFDPNVEKSDNSLRTSVKHYGHGGDTQKFELIRPDYTIRPSFNQTLCLHNFRKDKVQFSPCDSMNSIPWGMRWRQEVDEGNPKMFKLKQGSQEDIYSSGYLSLTEWLIKLEFSVIFQDRLVFLIFSKKLFLVGGTTYDCC